MCASRKHTQTHTYSADRTAVVDLSTTRSGQTELTGSHSGTGQPCSACNLNTGREKGTGMRHQLLHQRVKGVP